jgi:ATP-dependent Zn protease
MDKQKQLTKLSVFDFDDTLCEAVGTYESDRNLAKFKQDNTFVNNLKTKTLPTLNILFSDLKKNNCKVVIQTAREEKWWLPIILFFKGISYHHSIQRRKGETTSSD